jgi:FAD linked oxidases, C-terminal domain
MRGEELLQREELAQRREVSQVIELRFPNYGRQTVLARQIVGCSIRWHWRSLVTRTRRHRVRLKTVWATYDVVLPYDEADELYREIRAALEAHETVEKYGG